MQASQGDEKAFLSKEVPYVFLVEGTISSDFEIAQSKGTSLVSEEAAIVPTEAKLPQERVMMSLSEPEGLRDHEGWKSESDSVEDDLSYHWYDSLPGDPLYLEGDPEDVIEVGSLLEDMDRQRSAKLRVIREQEACLKHEVEAGEGGPTKEWLHSAYEELGEWEAQMFKLQAEFSQIIGQSCCD